MNPTTCILALFTSERLKALREVSRYINPTPGPWWSLLFWGCVLALIAVLLIAAARRSRKRSRWGDGPTGWGLFFRLLRATPLTWRQRLLLRRLARRAGLADPAAILLSPSMLAATAAAHAAGEDIDPIAVQLFGREQL